jgi:hypothetical protein
VFSCSFGVKGRYKSLLFSHFFLFYSFFFLHSFRYIPCSLSALGDVISGLSTGAKFIPYRNNKLTMLLSDGLGGNAKTLMFVNLSPADYNAKETVTSLVYASRVKLIKNVAKKESDSEAVAHYKKIIHEFETTGSSATLQADGGGADS